MHTDSTKLNRKILTLRTNIDREVKIQKSHITKKDLLLDYSKLTFDGKKQSYSKAMGAMQNELTKAAKGLCTLNRIKWAQVPTTNNWYDKLRMNVSASCSPNALIKLTNRLKENSTIYNIESFRATKDRRKALLNINIQIVAFRTNK